MARDIGIDLGTANVLIYLKDRGVVLNEPSLVAVDTKTNTVIAVGEKAYQMLGRTPRDVAVIHPLKGGVIADVTMAEQMLEQFIQRLNLQSYFQKPDILICIPTNITSVEQEAIIQTAIKSGGRAIYLEEEPKVAAVGVGLDIFAPIGNMVIDIGGGTSDVAVLSMGSTVVSRSIKLAGDDIDRELMTYLKETYQLIIGERTAEEIKMNLGTAVELEQEEEYTVRGRDIKTGLPNSVTLTSNEVFTCMKEVLETIAEEARLVLEATPPELAGDIMERGVMITGGGALIRGIDQFFSEKLAVPVVAAEEPLNSVALGTGQLLGRIKKQNSFWGRVKRMFRSNQIILHPTANTVDDKGDDV